MRFFIHKIVVAVVLILFVSKAAQAQNEPIIAHWAYHTNVFNPAAAGNDKDIYISGLFRQQWVGYKEAPSTQLINAHGYVKQIRGGIGLVLIHDMLGKERSISARVSYAYSQRLAGGKAFLSLGLSLGLLNRSIRGGELVYQTGGDQSAILSRTNISKPYLGLGLEFKGYNLTAGFSITNLDQSQKDATVYKVPRHYMGYLKYSWNINKNLNLTPGIFVRSSVFITQAEVNINATIKNRVVVGLIYRSTDAAGALLGLHIYKGLFASYSYDISFGKLLRYQTGSHEVNISYTIKAKKEKRDYFKSERYMN